jgi:hypothetical protein
MTFNLHLRAEWGIVDGKGKQGNIQRYFMRRELLYIRQHIVFFRIPESTSDNKT